MESTTEGTRPNILVITADQWPGPLMGVAGHLAIETPTLDQLAANGRFYPNAYTECPICIPARRSLMTGTSPEAHGDRIFQPALAMPNLPTMAQTFRDAGYQATAVGKLHVYPQRNRIGFDEVILSEEGRGHLGGPDDYDIFLTDQGYPGRGYLHGMSNNEYGWRPWHLPEHCHATNWASEQMARTIKRRDPTRPAFWHLSYIYPHPPIVPLQSYFDRYARRTVDAPVSGNWADETETLPPALQTVRNFWANLSDEQLMDVRRAFYAQCTHIDHQLRVVLGTLREEGLANDTIILFTSDHGDLLGDHGLYAKRYMYEWSARVPMILVGTAGDECVGHHIVDDRLVGLQDVMPTLLDLAGIDAPPTCTGQSMIGERQRDVMFCEALDGVKATRMVTDGRYKLIWYPCGNHVQLFDLDEDPREIINLADEPAHTDIRLRLEAAMISHLHGGDEAWVADGRLTGFPSQEVSQVPNRDLSGQRGVHYPAPPITDPSHIVGTP
ncbi:MAG: sulfatase-like hydrolase/transferase [Hyphomicrobiales bacterium]|nr:sulfatase-like hydrolase/transferase [Hyphomicrobiales bacterium]